MARSSRKEKLPVSNGRALITREITRGRDAQCNAGEFMLGNEFKLGPNRSVPARLF